MLKFKPYIKKYLQTDKKNNKLLIVTDIKKTDNMYRANEGISQPNI